MAKTYKRRRGKKGGFLGFGNSSNNGNSTSGSWFGSSPSSSGSWFSSSPSSSGSWFGTKRNTPQPYSIASTGNSSVSGYDGSFGGRRRRSRKSRSGKRTRKYRR